MAPIAKAIQGKFNTTMNLNGNLGNDFTPNLNSLSGDAFAEILSSTLNPLNAEVLNQLGSSLNFIDFKKLNLNDLKTTFQFDLGSNSAIAIADKLHPTPAVSGYPQKEALDLIHKSEKHQRRIYAGMIGVINEHSTQLFVNLRCAEIIHNQAYLYLGGGFTKDSNVVSEWNETENKAKTLLNVMKKQ